MKPTPDDPGTTNVPLTGRQRQLLDVLVGYIREQDAGGMAASAKRLRAAFPIAAPENWAYRLASFMTFYGHGYSEWQVSYDYPTVRQLFWAAAESIESMTPKPTQQEIAFYRDTSAAQIHYTRCENAALSADAASLKDEAFQAQGHATAALATLVALDLSPAAKDALRLTLSSHNVLFEGLSKCAELYLEAHGRQEVVDQLRREINTLVDRLYDAGDPAYSPEAGSELRAHLSFLKRWTDRRTHPLKFMDARLTWIASAKIADESAEALWQRCQEVIGEYRKDDQAIERFTKDFGLEVKNIATPSIQDTYATALGENQMQRLEFEFSPATVSFRGVSLELDVKLRMSPNGIVSVVLEGTWPDDHVLDVSMFRTLLGLLSPPALECKVSWTGSQRRRNLECCASRHMARDRTFALLEDSRLVDSISTPGDGLNGALQEFRRFLLEEAGCLVQMETRLERIMASRSVLMITGGAMEYVKQRSCCSKS